MFFFRVNFKHFQQMLAKICEEDEYMSWSDENTYRFLYYVEKQVTSRIESGVPFVFHTLVRASFEEFKQ